MKIDINGKGKRLYTMIGVVLGVIAVALGIQLGILNTINNRNFDNTALLLLDRVISVIETNEKNEQALINSLKDDYVVRAKTVAYMIDAKPEVEYDVKELKKIANLVSVDEIHLLDKEGKIYSGTLPIYYGYTLDSGKQIAYFKPMLYNHELAMCQDAAPNTAEHKKMMYAMVWDEKKERLVEVGIAPVRLLHELKQNEISEVVSRMPTMEGLQIFVANRDNGTIYGATDKDKIGKTLDGVGIIRQESEASLHKGYVYMDGEEYKVSFRFSGPYTIGVAWSTATNYKNNAMVLIVVGGYLLLAACIIVFMLAKVLKTRKERDNQFNILFSMAEIYRSMHLIDLEADTYMDYSVGAHISEKRKVMHQAETKLYQYMKRQTLDDDWDKVHHFIDLSTLPARLEGKKNLTLDYVAKDNRWFQASFIVIGKNEKGNPKTLIFTIRDIDEEKRREENLLYASHTDELTKCRNRRAYIEDAQITWSMKIPFVYVAMDVNGLKQVNDTLGHAAGDELIQGAAACMKQCFGSYGKIYRVGGDEFVALLAVDDSRLSMLRKDFEETVSKWHGKLAPKLNVACGYVSSQETHWPSMDEIEKAGDHRMYEAKNYFYSLPENNRRKR